MSIKPFLIVLAIFMIGFGAGFWTSGRITRNKIEAVKARQTPDGFKDDLYRYIKPDKAQQKYIDSIIAAYIPRIREEGVESRNAQKRMRDSMFTLIQTLLNNKQQSGLKKFEKEKIIKPQQVAKNMDTAGSRPAPGSVVTPQTPGSPYRLDQDASNRRDSAFIKQRLAMQNPELKRALRMYIRRNMLPVLMQYRNQFERELSAEELQLLGDIRAVRRDRVKRDRDEQGETPDLTPDERNLSQDQKEALRTLYQNHKASLDKIAAELKPLRDKWNAEMDEIRLSFYPEYKRIERPNYKSIERNTLDFLLMESGPGGGRPPRR